MVNFWEFITYTSNRKYAIIYKYIYILIDGVKNYLNKLWEKDENIQFTANTSSLQYTKHSFIYDMIRCCVLLNTN